jgi:hypothetical protein
MKQAKIAGILIITTGSIGVVSAVFGTWLIWALINAFQEPGANQVPFWVALAITIPAALIAVLVIIGGIYARREKLFGLAIIASILSIFWFFPLGIPSLVLLIYSRNEMKKNSIHS